MSNSGVLSQEEIDALLRSGNVGPEEPAAEQAPAAANATVAAASGQDLDGLINDMEKDAIGEVGNISMGSAATALSTLLDRRVEITAPRVEVTTYGRLRGQYPLPFLVVDVSYTRGLEGANLLVIRHHDASIIADLMMGNDGANPPDELSEFHLGAVGEAMNQMMGSACTAMSSVLGQRIEIGIPVVRTVNLSNEPLTQGADENEPIVKITFQMQVGELINSEIMQVIPVEFSRQMLRDLMQSIDGPAEAAYPTSGNLAGQVPVEEISQETPVANPTPALIPPTQGRVPGGEMYPPQGSVNPPQGGMFPPQGGMYSPQGGMYPPQGGGYPPQGGGYPPQGGSPYQPQGGIPYQPQGGMYQGYGVPPFAAANQAANQGFAQQAKVQVQPAQFASLHSAPAMQEYGNIGLIMDVPLQITVELGKTRKTIKEILALGPGSILELDKLAGEPVDLLVNGKLVAKGEVVVIDENFGVRVTDIISPIERVANLQ